MRKYFLIPALLLAGCVVEEDASSQPEFSPIVGHVFETKTDLLLYAADDLGGASRVSVDVPGSSRRAPALTDLPSSFPYSFEGELVLGILPAGSEFTVYGAKNSSNKLEGYSHTTLKSKLLTPEKYRGRELKAVALTLPGGRLNPALVKERMTGQ